MTMTWTGYDTDTDLAADLTADVGADMGLDARTSDRRRDTRVSAWMGVRVSEPYSGRCLTGLTVNVSECGMCLRLPADLPLRAGRFLSLRTLSTQLAALDPLATSRPARVVWTRPDPADATTQLVGLELYAATVSAAA